MPLSEEVLRTHGEDDVFDVPWRSKACREKSAEVIVPKARVCLKGRTESCNTIVNDCYLESLLSSDVLKETLYSHDRTESDNRIEVTYLEGMAENNLLHTVRCKSTKPPYAERHVRWCERSVNMKIGDKYLWLVFTSYSIIHNGAVLSKSGKITVFRH